MDCTHALIHLISNDFNDKVYVGTTINDMETRFMSHLCNAERKFAHNKLALDIRKHGRGHFRVTKLEDYACQSKEQLWRRESEYVIKYDSVDNGYNTIFPDRTMQNVHRDQKQIISNFLKCLV
jgi:predicted GIY-YIG superfamily endonuclease